MISAFLNRADGMNQIKGPLAVPEVKKIEEVCASLWDRKGKRLRSQWVFWFSEGLGISEQDLDLYAWAVEAIHTATLLHDDVIDKAPLRRGGPSANELFDNTLPVLSGDYLLSDAIHQLAEKGDSKLLKLMCLAVKEVTQGEVLQYENRYRIPETREYFEVLNRLKTTALLKWAAQVGSILTSGEKNPNIADFTLKYGSLYQLTDDILDIRGTSTKASWQDLSEGKVNEAVFLLLETFPEAQEEIEKAFQSRQILFPLIEKLKKLSLDFRFQTHIQEELYRRQETCFEAIRQFESKTLQERTQKLTQLTVERLF